jgi:hypothetical protein
MIRRGVAAGCSWWQDRDAWHWSAHGPVGSRAGTSSSEREAMRAAQRAMGELSARENVEAAA